MRPSDVNENKVEWDAEDINYYPNKEAVDEANTVGQKYDIDNLKHLHYDNLKKMLRQPGCTIKYMSRISPPRGKVHKQDWQKYLKAQIDQAKRIENGVEREVRKRLQ